MGILIVVAIVGVALYSIKVVGAGQLTPDQIQSVAANAGFTGDDLLTATAIAQAESSGNSEAVGDQSLGISVGLWQINLKAHPEYGTQVDLYDPQTNANAAYDIYSQAGGFSPWTTYRTGAYQQYL